MLFSLNKHQKLLSGCIFLLVILTACKSESENTAKLAAVINSKKTTDSVNNITKPKQPLSKDFKTYWYASEAEISSYKLQQYRYGQLREGTAVLVYVTEDFLPKKQVKADNYSKENTPVLKLNATKNFVTGIYPYSIMQSTFYPVANNKHALKVSASIQEWCGHVYTQLNNKDDFEITTHSYFETEADNTTTLTKNILENELWVQLRVNPKLLPTGELQIIPSLETIRLQHFTLKAYKAKATLGSDWYKIDYPELNRTLTINFNAKFPFDIVSWEETVNNNATKATKLKTIKTDYWNKKSIENESLRDSLLLN
ncbi:septum formation inhibitor Maf [Tamlana sp. 62-3]|uniref:Septum formation inhibitor Maf n=1 Tax=Neotamlana sargassicola TaxID=2883125 RepID=A0A9X1L728_9FLAO|nr:septum formation inhibitor Maf [Tamlana sargassicola]MCB4808401.1 septum formation inhibitor Maf [Tamlana sargassicola]